MTGARAPADRAAAGILPSLGAEIEMPVMDRSGASACVGSRYFAALARRRQGLGPVAEIRQAGVTVGLNSALGINGIDNGFNLLETAHLTIPPAADGLDDLARRMAQDLADVGAALYEEGLSVCSLAQHPTAGIDPADYARRVAPKAVYRDLVAGRGWSHRVGIDAKAQNGPTTGIAPADAIAALNLLLIASPVFIALFANSPFEGGAETGLMETRMTLWPRMVATGQVSADRDLCGLPPRLFESIGDYWRWTFGPGTVAQALPQVSGDYKGDPDLWVAGDGTMSVPDIFAQAELPARRVTDGQPGRIVPTAAHFAYLQWSNFLDIRLRFAFADPAPEREEIAAAFAEPALFDRIFATRLANLYLENRCAGACFPDRPLSDLAGEAVAQAAMIAPSALQAGLVMAARADLTAFLARWPLAHVARLRDHAIRHALGRPAGQSGDPEAGRLLHALCDEVLDLAARHLPEASRGHLAYAQWVRRTGMGGAHRALAAAQSERDLDALARSRRVLCWGG